MKKIEDLLHDPRYRWVAIDTIYNTPVMIFPSVEVAVDKTIGSDRYLLKPVRLYENKEANNGERKTRTGTVGASGKA